MMLTLLLSVASIAVSLLLLWSQLRQQAAMRQARENLQAMTDRMDALDAKLSGRKPEGPPNRMVRVGLHGGEIG